MAPKLSTLRDDSTEMTFVRAPGGTIDLGLQEKEIEELRTLIPKARELADARRSMARPRSATVAPFLVARAPLSRAVVATVADDFDSVGDGYGRVDAKNALSVVKALGYRLLTEDEWEYVARAGGSWLANVYGLAADAFGWKASGKKKTPSVKKNALGVDGLGWGGWVAGAKGKAPTIVRGGGLLSFPWQSVPELAMVHAAWRSEDPKGKWPLLVAWDGVAKPRKAAPAPGADWKGAKHVPTDLTFVDIPGGTFEMGLGKEERKRIAALVPAALAKTFAEVADECPPRMVTVKPFRCATSPLTPAMSKKLGGSTDTDWWVASNEPKLVAALAKKFGLRLLTEEEWEYVARDGGERGWGADLELLLKRVYAGGATPTEHVNRFGVEKLIAAAYVDTGTKLPQVARSLAAASYMYPNEIVERSIKNARTRSRDWRAALFAVG